jgi:glycosyltransferase involved in cell wall biosynthesis
MIIGIDATHVVGGGALSHLKLVLDNYRDVNTKISKIYIWAPIKTLNLLVKNKNIIKHHNAIFEFNFIFKAIWQFFFLKKNLKKFNCDLLFVPTGIFYTNFKPVITMSQNLMPFYNNIVNEHFPHLLFFKMKIQKCLFIKSFNNATKVIFLSDFAKKYIIKFINQLSHNLKIINHSIDPGLINFFQTKKKFLGLKSKKKIKICLLSDINFNKNYPDILRAISLVRKTYNIQLLWIGDKNKILFDSFSKLKDHLNGSGEYIFYKGLLSHKKTMQYVKKSDIFLYSSYCESFPVTILEGMASKLPMVILDHPLYKEILGNNAFFFRNNNVEDLKSKIILAIEKSSSYQKFSKKNIQLLQCKYNPKQMSLNTFKILEDTFIEYNYRNKILK